MKLCRDCENNNGAFCNIKYIDVVDGEKFIDDILVGNARHYEVYCGVEAKYFKPKEDKPVLKRCPCGEVPSDLRLDYVKGDREFTIIIPNCCEEWRLMGAYIVDSSDAIEMWNNALRGDEE